MIAFLFVVYGGRHYVTADTIVVQTSWWNYLLQHSWHGIATMNSTAHSDYTTIWYVVIEIFIKIGLYPHFPIEFSLKFLAAVTTILSALAVFAITRHFHRQSRYLPILAAAVTLFLPTFFMDYLKANLSDGLYIAPMLWSFYFFTKKRYGAAWLLLGLSACFKLMAIYLAPVYLFVYLRDFTRKSWREKLAPLYVIVAVIICSIPNMLTGGNFLDGIIGPILSRSNGGGPFLFLIPWGNNLTGAKVTEELRFVVFGLLIFALFMIGFFVWRYVKTRARQNQLIYTILPTLSILLCYMLMPAQHEAYFAAAGVFALIGFVITLRRELFINFVAVNTVVFVFYLIGVSWWNGMQEIWVFPPGQTALIMWGIIGWNLYLIFRVSIFNRPKILADNDIIKSR